MTQRDAGGDTALYKIAETKWKKKADFHEICWHQSSCDATTNVRQLFNYRNNIPKKWDYHHKTLERQHKAGKGSLNLCISTQFRIWFYEECIIWQIGR